MNSSFVAQPAFDLGHAWLTHFSSGFGPADPANPNQYGERPFAPPPRKSGPWMWILGGCGCTTVLLLLCCGGFTWWGVSASTQILAQALKDEVAGNPIVAEHLGEIRSLKANLMESGKEKRQRNSNSNWVVMDAEGSKGNGKFVVEASRSPTPGNIFTTIELRLPNGTTVPIK